eukprot:CAMPEP_0172551566 /NCGR_PEP_ID=MMETSP1067-20121228/40080_1 /TAXON_ID=265564 ORGANISM="Thalassiosira punctigera, Strain Tpunct2005C2" /NCGR_SAMPLE_ID=MMETSP1067 /ASSEMBLY_ACC=CAM_ASM_000444 /LENGTH=43 /DNA_ID= /DNA_START= /DNA_END= /DNA_ORIENTATION=
MTDYQLSHLFYQMELSPNSLSNSYQNTFQQVPLEDFGPWEENG